MDSPEQNPIARTLKEHIREQEATFVFPTQTSASEWADRATAVTGVSAVAMERFVAWDDFKGASIRSMQQEKRSVPSVLRSLFAARLIRQNAEEQFLSYLIAPEYARTAGSFSAWIAGILPSLAQWHRRFTRLEQEGALEADAEDRDYLEIYTRYKRFLDGHGLFDPAWETPPFNPDGRRYFIFFPEILMDYAEYQPILESSPDITLVRLPDPGGLSAPECRFYDSARTELRQLALRLRLLHDGPDGVGWADMAISVPDAETYVPYLHRELELYEIPHVERTGKALTACGAGSFFVQAQECVRSQFSYASIRTLLLNRQLPWDDTALIDGFIRFGRENNCICSYQDGDAFFDAWEEAFKAPSGEQADERMKELYRALRHILTAMAGARTFSGIREQYFAFRNHFFDMSRCPEQSDRIISRCITELNALIDLEEEFPDCLPPEPYPFFVSYLADKMYVPQSPGRGVQVFPYRLASTAPFACHFVIDASQASAAVNYRRLGFLSDQKRERLGFADDANVTAHFLRLYALSATHGAFFSAAEKTFSGYALTNAALAEKDCRQSAGYGTESLDAHDMYLAERRFLRAPEGGAPFPGMITTHERDGFRFWQEAHGQGGPVTARAKFSVDGLMDQRLREDGKVRISYSVLRAFYADQHTFMLERVLGIKEEQNEAVLMDKFAAGNLYHAILEHYCTALKARGLPLAAGESGLDEPYRALLEQSVSEATARFRASALAKRLIETSRDSLLSTVTASVRAFSAAYPGYEIDSVETPLRFDPPEADYFFTGRIDCLLRDPATGDCALVDFKSSDGAIHEKEFFVSDDVPVPDFQMPVYLHLLEHDAAYRHKPVTKLAFFNVSEGKLVPVTEDLTETRARFLELAVQYAACVREHRIDSEEAKDAGI